MSTIPIYKRKLIDPDQHISPHFTWKEYMCKCGKCNEIKLHDDLFPLLEMVRERTGGHPIRINSGFRCSAHNAHVMGAPRSRHLFGEALDISSQNVSNVRMGEVAKEVGFTGVKVYANWVHVDVRDGKPWYVGV